MSELLSYNSHCLFILMRYKFVTSPSSCCTLWNSTISWILFED